ncbi:hypothetical protein OL548_11495 [Lysinibacillus sp. MHQ-1]|nr:hypothetical protein OL548_11495 [Lysinibacillus sp. MHQ-1]
MAGVAFETDLGAVIILCGIAVSVVASSGIPFKTFWKFFWCIGGIRCCNPWHTFVIQG